MKATKRLLSFILAVAMLFSVCAFNVAAEDGVTLTDIDMTTEVGKAVNKLVTMSIINGYPDGTYRPDNTITRAEFSVVMVKFAGLQGFINPEAYTGFEDLDTDDNYAWVRPYVAMAVQRGVISGFEDGTFRAADPVTYEQAVKMIVCSLGYNNITPTIAGDWSSGYIAKAMQLNVTDGTSIGNKSAATTRGVVAILVSNALDAQMQDTVTDNGITITPGGTTTSALGFYQVKGIVDGTYITELEYEKSSVPRDHISINGEIYKVGFSTDPNEFMGCEVEAIVNSNTDGDYPVVTGLTLTRKTNTLEITADFIGPYEDGELQYLTKKGGNWKSAKISEEYITIFNNKRYDYDITNLEEELVSGSVVLVDNDGDKSYDVVRINSYEVFVVYSKNSTKQNITLMYDAQYEGSSVITFPEDSTSLLFTLTRNGRAISFSDISKWDVINIKASPDDAEGRRYYEVVVTRETVSGYITERDSEENQIVIGDNEYYIADSFMDATGDNKPELAVGEYVQVYLDADGKIVAAAESTAIKNSEAAYAYLYALRQNSTSSEYELEFRLYTTSGKFVDIGAASKITIDGVKYKADDEDILDYLKDTAEAANAPYGAAENIAYHQLVSYQTNAEGLVSVIDTICSEDNEKISAGMDDGVYYAAYEERTYKSSAKSFTDFKVNSSTKIIYVPDNRSSKDDYMIFSSYSGAFANSRDYHVEAYGLSSSKTASVVLIYKENDTLIYTSNTPFMIVTSKSVTSKGTIIKGYVAGVKNSPSYTEKSITVFEDGPSIADIGKGDVIRYLTNTKGELTDYDIWFDASEPVQEEACNTIDEAIDSRILEIHSTDTEPRKNYPTAAFRLQYGTVTEISTEDDGYITVSPTIREDMEDDADGVTLEMAIDGDGVVSRDIGSSVKVFVFDGDEVTKEGDLSEVLAYVDYEADATRVITYSASSTLRLVYIIFD